MLRTSLDGKAKSDDPHGMGVNTRADRLDGTFRHHASGTTCRTCAWSLLSPSEEKDTPWRTAYGSGVLARSSPCRTPSRKRSSRTMRAS